MAEHYYDKPTLKNKAHFILNAYEKLWGYAIAEKNPKSNNSNNNSDNPPSKRQKKS